MTDLAVLAQAIGRETRLTVDASPIQAVGRDVAITTLRTLANHLGVDGTLNGGDLQDLIDTLKDLR